MYESFFRFHDRPFAAAPLVASFFPAEGIEHARQTLIRLIERAEGPGLVVGPAGVGKSLLCRLLGEYFRDRFDVVMLASSRIGTRKALLQSILFELGMPYRGLEEGELRLSLLDFLQPGNSSDNGLLLIVDEAHTLPLHLLDEIRMITNLVRDGQVRVRLVLAGGPKLEERFAHPKLESFNQRLAARCYLETLSREDTQRYVYAQLAAAGGEGSEIFDKAALDAVYRATDGIPRLINQVCDHALVLSCAGGRRQLGAADIEEAWSDLQQLPGPWQKSPAGLDDASDEVVEFGTWDASDLEQAQELGQADIPVDAPLEGPVDAQALDGDPSDPALAAEQYSEPETDDAMAIANEPPPTPTPAEEMEPEFATLAPRPIVDEFVDEFAENESLVGVIDVELECPKASETSTDFQSQPEPATTEASGRPRANPFGDFAEEEVIVDQLTARAIEAFQGRPRVTSPLGQEIAAALATVETTASTASEELADQEDSNTVEAVAVQEDAVQEDAVQEDTVQEVAVDAVAVEEDVVERDDAVSDDAVSDDAVSDDAVSDDAVSDAAFEDECFQYTVLEDAVLEDAVLENHLLKNALGSEVELIGLSTEIPDHSESSSSHQEPEEDPTPPSRHDQADTGAVSGEMAETPAARPTPTDRSLPDNSPKPTVKPLIALAEAEPLVGPAERTFLAFPVNDQDGDDRDLIILEGGPLHGEQGLDDEPATRTLEYGELFAQLRQA